jgi:hypothetical protein
VPVCDFSDRLLTLGPTFPELPSWYVRRSEAPLLIMYFNYSVAFIPARKEESLIAFMSQSGVRRDDLQVNDFSCFLVYTDIEYY